MNTTCQEHAQANSVKTLELQYCETTEWRQVERVHDQGASG